MSGEPVVTLVGNVVADPEVHVTSSGATVARFRVASTPRHLDRQTNEWKDGESVFLSCSVWRQAGENVAESLTRGMRVIVVGRLKQRSYRNEKGENNSAYEVEVDEVGPSLRYTTAHVIKNARTSVPAGSRAEPAPSAAEDPFAPADSPADGARPVPEDQKVPF
jgi:single-strand DNA-binding protein